MEPEQEKEDRRMSTSPVAPPITDALRAEARANPGGWIYAIDQGYKGSADVPPQGIVGAWQVDEKGELIAEFTPNPRYLPTPQARGWTRPTTPLERALQLLLSGYISDEQMAREFASAEVFVFSRPEGGLFLAPAEDGGQLVYAFTDADKAAASGHTENRGTLGSELATALPEGVRIALNPGHEVSAILEPADIAAQ